MRKVGQPALESTLGQHIFQMLRWILFMSEILYSFLSWTENPHRTCSVTNGSDEEIIHSTPIKRGQRQIDQSAAPSGLQPKTDVAILDSQTTEAGLADTSKMVIQI